MPQLELNGNKRSGSNVYAGVAGVVLRCHRSNGFSGSVSFRVSGVVVVVVAAGVGGMYLPRLFAKCKVRIKLHYHQVS